MPIFEFRCDKCGEEFERFVLMSEKEGIECTHCRSRDTRRLMSATSSYGKFKDLGSSCKSSGTGHG
ncbi:MAG: zinc ribbon domain-containing protein [Thermodesulfobacteriota bacterium]